MSTPHFEVHDGAGVRDVPLDHFPFTIGRRDGNDLQLSASEVSREHAEIVQEDEGIVLRDRESRYGTYVNGERVTECVLKPGDRVRLGRGGGADLVFVTAAADAVNTISSSSAGARDDLRLITALLERFRALGSGRVLQEVLTLVLDAAIDISGAERALIMLSTADGTLEFKLGRAKDRQMLTHSTFETSRKVPEEVYRTGATKVVTDLFDAGLAGAHMGTVALGIRHVVCVPLNLVRYVEAAEAKGDDHRIGVLYLDSREKGTFLSDATRNGLEALAAEASVAIENARLYREKVEKGRMEQEMRIAAEIQQALLPKPRASLGFVEAAAASVPCRSIGGDFFEYLDQPGSEFGFTLGDVSGKGPPAALMSALMQGMFAAQAASDGPAASVMQINRALCRRGIESRFVTLMFGNLSAAGDLLYCNAGHNPPLVFGKAGIRRLETGGPVLGLLADAPFDEGREKLDPGDVLVLFSDGVSEAFNVAGEDFGEARLIDVSSASTSTTAQTHVERIIAAVKSFTKGAAQSDDITVMVIRYLGPSA